MTKETRLSRRNTTILAILGLTLFASAILGVLKWPLNTGSEPSGYAPTSTISGGETSIIANEPASLTSDTTSSATSPKGEIKSVADSLVSIRSVKNGPAKRFEDSRVSEKQIGDTGIPNIVDLVTTQPVNVFVGQKKKGTRLKERR